MWKSIAANECCIFTFFLVYTNDKEFPESTKKIVSNFPTFQESIEWFFVCLFVILLLKLRVDTKQEQKMHRLKFENRRRKLVLRCILCLYLTLFRTLGLVSVTIACLLHCSGCDRCINKRQYININRSKMFSAYFVCLVTLV